MTVSSSINRSDFAGNGSTTAFATGFRFLQNSDIKVILTVTSTGIETVQVEVTNYTLVGAGLDAGGTVTMLVAPATGETLTIKRDVPLTQGTDYVENDTFPAESHEDALDKLTMIVQQQQEELDRSVKLSESSQSTDVTIPDPNEGDLIRWDDQGNLENISVVNLDAAIITPFGRDLIDSPDAPAARDVLELDRLSPDTLAIWQDDTRAQAGDVVTTKERSTGNGGGATGQVISGTGTANGFNIVAHNTLGLSFELRLSDAELVDKWGAIGDGATNDQPAIKAAIDVLGKVIFDPLKNYFTSAQINVTTPTIIDFQGAEVSSSLNSDTASWFFITADDVTLKNGVFGDLTTGGQVIGVNDLSNAKVSDATIDNCSFNHTEWGDNRAMINLKGFTINMTISNCKFRGSLITSTNSAAIFYQMDGTTVTADTRIGLKVINNFCNGVPKLFNNFSNGFVSNVLFHGNTIRSAVRPLRTYHIFECIVSENSFLDCTDYTYIWQRAHCVNNVWDNCGDGVDGSIKLETPTATVFDSNEIRNANGHGLIIDGGPANTSITNNSIFKPSKSGIFIDPNFDFGGQVTQLTIQGNYIRESFEDGISINATSAFRGIFIKDNQITASGALNGSNVAGVLLKNTAGVDISRLVIKDNVITDSDLGAGVTGNTEWGYKYDGIASSMVSVISHNVVYANIPFFDTTSGGDNLVVYNVVNDPTLINVSGTTTQGGKFPLKQFFNVGHSNKITDGQGDLRLNGIAAINAATPDFIGQRAYNRDVSDPSYFIAVDESVGGDGSDLQFKRISV